MKAASDRPLADRSEPIALNCATVLGEWSPICLGDAFVSLAFNALRLRCLGRAEGVVGIVNKCRLVSYGVVVVGAPAILG